MNSIWVIEESPNPGIWIVMQSRGMYKSPLRATKVARELQDFHLKVLQPGNSSYGYRYRATEYVPRSK